MSKSLRRVRAALEGAGIDPDIRETALARTAADAAAALGCAADAIAKSVILRGEGSGDPFLFLTAGGNRVDPNAAARLAGEPLGPADAAFVRARTGFAIGGVAPIGHPAPPRAFWDPALDAFPVVWAAAGTPHHVFGLPPDRMRALAAATPGPFTERPGTP